MTGSLICLSYDEFQTFCFATVTGQRDPDKLAKGEFRLKFEFQNKVTDQISPVVALKMAESNVYFEVIFYFKDSTTCFVQYFFVVPTQRCSV